MLGGQGHRLEGRLMFKKLKKLRKKMRKRRLKSAWNTARNDALFRASNGERLPRLEREMYKLPDWTG